MNLNGLSMSVGAASSASHFAAQLLPSVLPDLFSVILCHCCRLCCVPDRGLAAVALPTEGFQCSTWKCREIHTLPVSAFHDRESQNRVILTNVTKPNASNKVFEKKVFLSEIQLRLNDSVESFFIFSKLHTSKNKSDSMH